MGYKLRRWLADRLPTELSPGERSVALEVADWANDMTGIAYGAELLETVARRAGLANVKQVGEKLTGLGKRGIELRVAVRTGPKGQPVFAYRGHQTTYRVPLAQEAGLPVDPPAGVEWQKDPRAQDLSEKPPHAQELSVEKGPASEAERSRESGQKVPQAQDPSPHLSSENFPSTSPLPPEDPPAPAQRQPRTEEGMGMDFEEQRADEKPPFDTDALVAEVRTVRPEWGRSGIAKAITAALADGRPEHLIRPAALAVARDPETRVPGRLNHDGDWWHRAADPFAAKPHCGRCDSDTRLVWGDDNSVTNCPRCWTPRDPEHARRAHANRIHDMPACEHGRPGGHVPCPATGWVACDFERRRIGWVAMDETPRGQGGGYRAFVSSDLQDFNANFDTHRTYRMSTTDARVAQALALGDQYPDDEQTPQITNGAPW